MHSSELGSIGRDAQRIRLAILANEFFDESVGAIGGFGWAATRVASLFRENPRLGVDPTLLSGRDFERNGISETMVGGTRLLFMSTNPLRHWRRLRRERIDLLLTIDFRLSYRRTLLMLPRTPTIIWSRDPRDHDDRRRIATLQIPGSTFHPLGADPVDLSWLATLLRIARAFARPVGFATPTPFLKGKLGEAYGVESLAADVLPNPLELPSGPIVKSPNPVVLFLARLDPYKRPWIFVEIARRFPAVEFVMLGRPHFHGDGGWTIPDNLPPNVRVRGHVDGEDKSLELSRAWMLVNTSIHEGLPVSFQEALAHETPIVSCLNPENVVGRFGLYVGEWNGTGLESIGAYSAAVARLLEDHQLRTRLGREGREWVARNHGTDRFLREFSTLVARLAPSRGNLEGGLHE